jgi:succinate dehydrogenase/fumarate reductase flavoprotein subunit
MVENAVECDVLVVGGGGAGLRAAIAARQQGAKTLLVNKGTHGKSGATAMAGADLTADGRSLRRLGFFGEPRDTPEHFFLDILHQGFYLNNQKLLEIYIRDAGDRLGELLDWGMPVERSDERAIFTSGPAISRALVQWAKAVGIEVASDVMTLELITKDGRATGALGLDLISGELVHFKARAVVLATGGWHKAFYPTTGPRDLSGEGVAMAYRAGAALANMEFITFCCNVILWPPIWQGSPFAYALIMLFGGKLTNKQGDTFLDAYDPDVVRIGMSSEWNKCFISWASQREVQEGRGSPHGGIYLDNGDTPLEVFDRRVRAVFPGWRYHATDFAPMAAMLRKAERIEVGPAAEYFEGGIAVDEGYGTSIEGLYAAGECATSPFGANRVVAATTEMLVSGALAGSRAAQYALGTRLTREPKGDLAGLQAEILRPLESGGGVRPAEVRNQVQRLAHSHLGPIRTKDQLEELASFLEGIQKEKLPALSTTSKNRCYNKEWVDALELKNMVQLLELSARAALMRTESRGVHYRSDFPYTDNDHWLQEIVARKQEDCVEWTSRPVVATRLLPGPGTKPYMDMLKEMMLARSVVSGPH